MKKIVNGMSIVKNIRGKKLKIINEHLRYLLLCISFNSEMIYFLKFSDQILQEILRFVRNLLCAQKIVLNIEAEYTYILLHFDIKFELVI